MNRFALTLVVLALAASSAAQDAEVPAEALEEQVWELRLQARYAEAADVARELVVLRKEDPAARAFEIADAARLLETLQHIAGLPDEAKRELALADSLTEVDEACWDEGRYLEAAAAMQRQLEIRRRLLGDMHSEVAASLSGLALDLNYQGDHAGAEAACREALEMQRKLLGEGHPDVAASTHNLAYFLHSQGDYASAEPLYHEALAMIKGLQGDEAPDIAACLNNIANLRLAQGDYAGAAPLLHEALAMNRKFLGNDHPVVVAGLGNLAALLYAQGDYAGAEPLFREALTMRRELHGREHPEVAVCLSNLGSLLYVQGNYSGAEPVVREALEMQRKLLGDEHPDVALSLNNLAMAIMAQGDYASAEPLSRKALVMRRKLLGNEHPDVAQSLNTLALLLDAQGDYAGAEPLFREALAMDRKLFGSEHPRVATDLNNIAHILWNQGHHAAAEPLSREALAMSKKLLGEEHPAIATHLTNLATELKSQGDYLEAEPLFREALMMRRKLLGTEHPDVASILDNLAGLSRSQGDFVGAVPLRREALEMRRKFLGEEHPYVALSLDELAMDLSILGDQEEAEALLAEAARIHDTARLRAGAGLRRVAFQRSPYSQLAAVRVALGRTDGAWLAAERALARSLADLVIAAGGRDLNPAEMAREDSLSILLGQLEGELGAYIAAARADSTGELAGQVESARNALLDAESEWSAFQQDMAARYTVTEGETFPLGRVQSALPAETAIIGWLDAPIGRYGQEARTHDSWCYAIRSTGPVVWARVGPSLTEGGSRSPFDRARSFREDLARPTSPDAIIARGSHGLWTERIGPLLGGLEGMENLIVIPSGAMLGVPVEALVDDDGVSVGETYAVSYTPSATLHTWLAERADPEVGSGSLLAADPPYNPAHLAAMCREKDVFLASAELMPGTETLRSAVAGNDEALRALPRLRGTRNEAAAIAAVCKPSSLLLGPEASEQELVRLAEAGRLADFMAIHIATHALVDDERPERSALVLSQVDLPDPIEAAMAGTRIYDGLVTAEEILREWDLNADLVTLSACETGLGKEVGGEGYVGFAHAFLQAGARSLLVSLWEAEDEATSLLMQRFYENWLGEYEDTRHGRVGEPMTKAEALQEAKQHIRTYEGEHGHRPYKHPFFWSAFVLIGDPT